MMRTLFYSGIILLILSSCTSKTTDKSESDRNDSIKKYLDLAGDFDLDFELRNNYNDKAFSNIDLISNDTLTRNQLSVLLYNYINLKNSDKTTIVAKNYFDMITKSKDTLNLARYYRYIGGYLMKKQVNDSAFYYFLKAEKFYKRTNDQLGLAAVYNNKGQIQYFFDDYLGAILGAKKAYRIYKKMNNLSGQYHSLNALGNNYNELKDYKNAVNSFELALEILRKDNSIANSGTCLNNIGNAYRENKRFVEAIHYFNLALKDKESLKNDPCLHGFLLNNLAYCKMQLKDYSGLPNMLYDAVGLMRDGEGFKESAISYIYLSNYFVAEKDTLKACRYAEKALQIAKKVKAPYYYLTALCNAGSIDSKKASIYIKEYHEINDSLYLVEIKTRNQYFTIQLETNDIKQEKETVVKQKLIITSLSAVIIFVIVLLLIITKQRVKQKELQFIQSQQKTNEEIYDLMLLQKTKEEEARQSEKKRIALELHDGVMNKLASTRLNLDVLHHKKDDATIKECLNYIDDIYNIEQEIRSISHDLTYETFTNYSSFSVLINDFITSLNKTSGCNFKLEMDKSIKWEIIPSNIKMNLFRIIQESSHNINKFAQAKNAIICFVIDNKNLCLSITDDGTGFDTEIQNEGIGLKNIKQRVDLLQGKFIIQSTKGKSTSLNISIPIQ